MNSQNLRIKQQQSLYEVKASIPPRQTKLTPTEVSTTFFTLGNSLKFSALNRYEEFPRI